MPVRPGLEFLEEVGVEGVSSTVNDSLGPVPVPDILVHSLHLRLQFLYARVGRPVFIHHADPVLDQILELL